MSIQSSVKSKYKSFRWEKDLNPAQKQAVESISGPLMVLAGAGSGKTRVISYRIAYLASTRTVSADKIMALTFTNKAAQEMQSRILKLIRDTYSTLWVGTFHSLFSRILRREAKHLGFTSNFSIYDEQDQLRAVKNVIVNWKLPTGNHTPQIILSKISKLKSRLVSTEEYAASDDGSPWWDFVSPVYTMYMQYLKANNALDFDDLLMSTYRLFKGHPDLLKKYQNKFKYILVDEFQDTNLAQYQILTQLAAEHRNICVVGDDDQSIYRWRGAEIKNILQFEHDFPDTKVIRLEQNYRSTKNILTAANSVIKNNRIRHDKTLWTDKGDGEKVILHRADTDRDEAQWVAQNIESEVLKEKWKWSDFAILYRLNAQSRLFEDQLRRNNIPYTVVGGLRFYERKEVKDVLAYLSIIVNPSDSIMLKRIINYPHRGIGKQTVSKIEAYAQEQSLSLYESLKQVDRIPGLTPARLETLKEFYSFVSKYRKLKNQVSLVELVVSLIEALEVFQLLEREYHDDAAGRIENIRELLRAIEEYGTHIEKATLESYLSEVVLLTDIDNWDSEKQHVSIMTFHAAKGLEFPIVYVTGAEEGILPIASSLEDPDALEEERRLFYVGTTRAMNILHITSAHMRGMYGKFDENPPSRFLCELEKKSFIQTDAEPVFTFDAPPKKPKTPHLVPASQLSTNGQFKTGMKVAHPDFGVGVIRSVEKKGASTKIKVTFEGQIVKTLMAEYAPLRIIR